MLSFIKNWIPLLKKKDIFLSPYNKITSKYIHIQDKNDVLLAYVLIPTIRAIIDRKAELFANVVIEEINSQGKKIEQSPFLKVLQNPHPFYSQKEFLKTIAKQFYLFQESFIYVNRQNQGGLLQESDTMLVLPANMTKALISKDFDIKQIKSKSDYLRGYELEIDGKKITFTPDEVIHITATPMKTIVDNHTQLQFKAIEKSINTLMSAYNVVVGLYRRNGGFGILTNNANGTGAEMYNNKIKNEEKIKLQEEFRDYSFDYSDYNMIITNSNLKYQPISYPLADMQLSDNFLQAKKDICDVLGFDILTLNNIEGSTYANLETADRKIYSDNIIPTWKLFESEFNNQNLTINRIYFDYSEIQALQNDRLTDIQVMQANDNVWLNRYNSGACTFNEMLIAIGLEPVANGDNYKNIQQNENQ